MAPVTYVVFLVFQMRLLCLIRGNKVLLVSMDGFRWDYINQVDTPNFDALADKGTRAEYINGTFVTKTFPSQYTIATGLYEESHGIIANSMYDPVFDEYFNKGSAETKWWNGGEPLWVTARKQGLKSAVFFWVGSETEIRGLRPNIYFAYNETVPFNARVDTVVQWLSNDIDLAMLYFNEPDTTGHRFGPDSPQVRAKVKEMDDVLGYIVDEFHQANLWETVNVIVTSDHGMTEVDYATKHVDLSEHIDMDAVDKIQTTGATANILPKANMGDAIIRNLTNVSHIKVYRKEDIPERWHYKNHRRILPILVVADEGWVALKGPEEYSELDKGDHGYDNTLMSMKPIFYARGPNIKTGYETLPFNSVDIYPLICELLCLRPAPNNGTLNTTQSFIVNVNSSTCSADTSGSSPGSSSGLSPVLLFSFSLVVLSNLLKQELDIHVL